MTAGTCVVCARAAAEREHVCEPCRLRLRNDLRQIITEYALLDATPGASTGQRVSGTRDAPLPGRLGVLNLLGPGCDSVTDPHGDQHGELPTVTLLDQWVRDWRDTRAQREHLPVPTVASLVGWLDVRLDWACSHHSAVDEFATEVRGMLRTLLAANGRIEPAPDREQVGPCPMDGCGALLHRYPGIDVITCTACGAEWRRQQWPWLARVIADGARESA